MTVADADPAATLRRAAELAPTVLPARIGKMIGSSIGRFLPDDIKYAGDAIFEMAAEVLALAEQQQAGPGRNRLPVIVFYAEEEADV